MSTETPYQHFEFSLTRRDELMAVPWDAFIEIINAHDKFVLTSHIRPDCDALGSELGMRAVLHELGKDVMIVNGHATPPNLSFIDPEQCIRVIGEDIQLEDLKDRDVLMVLDTSAWAQLGPMGDALKELECKKIVLDHHQGEDDLGAEFFKDSTAEAAGRLVLDAADALGVMLNAKIARPLFAAIATDTGWFRFGSAGAGTYHAAARLIDAGARPAEIYGELYEQETTGRIRLRGLVLQRIEAQLEGRLAHTYIRCEDFQQTGALPSDTEDLVNLCLTIHGTQAALILVEQTPDVYKVSFRSRCDLDASEVAREFGGGGHKAAAGAGIEGSLEDCQSRLLDAMMVRLQ